MSSKRTQHRTQRDTSNKENASLKKENKELCRTVARLQREIQRLNQLTDEDGEPIVEESPEIPTLKCPECGSKNLSSITSPAGAVRYSCKGCKAWRGTL